jgi:hypothetical protein
MYAGGSLAARKDSFVQAFPCQMAGANYYDFEKTGCKRLNCLK